MKNKPFQRALCFLLSVTLLLGMFGFAVSAEEGQLDYKNPLPGEENPYSASTLEEMKQLVGTLSYSQYLEEHDFEIYQQEQLGAHLKPIVIDVVADRSSGGEIVSESTEVQDAIMANQADWLNFPSTDAELQQNTLFLPDSGSVTWTFDISPEEAGFYFVEITYFSCNTSSSSISSIERKLKIDDVIPFKEAGSLDLDKTWAYQNIEVSDPEPTDLPDGYYKVSYSKPDAKGGYKKYVTTVEGGMKTVTTYTIDKDINNNSMSPEMSSVASWHVYNVVDASGYNEGSLAFYFSQGLNRTITLEAIREPMIISSIRLVPVQDETSIPTYEEYYENCLEQFPDAGAPVDGSVITLEAEFPDMVSDSSVAPTNDNTSSLNSPILPDAQVFNIIGENSYSSVGQWAAYKFRVTADGFYNLGMRFKQSALQGMFVCRTIKISGGHYGETPIVPFEEAYGAEFKYDKSWQSKYIGIRNQSPFLFYLEEGKEYTLYLECSLGTLREYIERVEASLNVINSCYLSILQLTGTDPDENTDYGFMANLPDVVMGLLEQAIELMDVKQGLEKLCGTNGSHIATLETIAILLNTMGNDEGEKIPENMSTLKSYLGTLGTWINNSKSSSISVDRIIISPAKDNDGAPAANKKNLPGANSNFFESLWFEVRSFFCSFFVEYDQMGLTSLPDKNTTTIDVWLATGRDQSQIWRTMIDAENGYTSSTGNAVALKLVTAGTLLPSILSGKGPEVYIGLGAADVINYAIRNAVIGISGNSKSLNADQDGVFSSYYYTYKYYDSENDRYTYKTTTDYIVEDAANISFVSKPFDKVVTSEDGSANFAKAAMDTVTLLDVAYGIPQTMGFAMMFYRMDVLAELGQEVPESWGELLAILPVLQSNNMSIGVSYISALDFMIYQEGGSMWKYTNSDEYDSKYAGARVDLDSPIALDAFEFTCQLYTDFSFPVSYDAANRFRTGEMPIIIGDYASIYNQLVVYATEIEGLWEFCSLPGSDREDGSFNYDSLAGVSATVILNGAEKNQKKLIAAWQFMQWQSGHEAQADYGNRMVALIGPSAKYETANLKAIQDLSWTAKEKAAIMNQMDHLSSIVNYPGSYIITRYMQFAFLDVVNNSANPTEALTGYVEAINTELKRKRSEFGLWVPKNSKDEPPMKIDSAT